MQETIKIECLVPLTFPAGSLPYEAIAHAFVGYHTNFETFHLASYSAPSHFLITKGATSQDL